MARDGGEEERDTTVTTSECPCAGSAESCPYSERRELLYWCEICGRTVAEKRCPLCGLKARKIRGGAL